MNQTEISANILQPRKLEKTTTLKKKLVVGSRRVSNYFWSGTLFLGGIGFLLAGLSSYFKINLLPFTNCTAIVFFPQGIIMTFYGILATSLSIYIGLTILWDVGSGYNEFDKEAGVVRIVRNGFPGKNKQIFLVYFLKSIQSIQLKIQEGINPKRVIYLCLKDQRKIPLTSVGQPLSLTSIENEASDLAFFLGVKLEGI